MNTDCVPDSNQTTEKVEPSIKEPSPQKPSTTNTLEAFFIKKAGPPKAPETLSQRLSVVGN